MTGRRIEHDVFGSLALPTDALYGPATGRALENSGVTHVLLRDRPELVSGLAWTKAAAARANAQLEVLPGSVATAIQDAAGEVAGGRWADQFPLPVLQGGGGTSANMNVNEVLAARATQLLGGAPVVHPLDHVNRSQSTNDVYPTALNIAVTLLTQQAADDVQHLAAVCSQLADQIPDDLTRLARTCLQDAIPVPIAAATHGAHAHGLSECAADLLDSAAALARVPLGATAVGTGLGAPPGYRERAIDALCELTGLRLVAAANAFDSLANAGPYLRVMQAANRTAILMAKIAQDMRLLSSGPVGGIGELTLPAVQVGSSAMPGKVNPVVPELVIQVSHRMRGATAAVESATAAGELELNVMTPVIALELLGGLRELGGTARLFADRCLVGVAWNLEAIEQHLRGSLAAAVELAADEGYSVSSQRYPLSYPPLGG